MAEQQFHSSRVKFLCTITYHSSPSASLWHRTSRSQPRLLPSAALDIAFFYRLFPLCRNICTHQPLYPILLLSPGTSTHIPAIYPLRLSSPIFTSQRRSHIGSFQEGAPMVDKRTQIQATRDIPISATHKVLPPLPLFPYAPLPNTETKPLFYLLALMLY